MGVMVDWYVSMADVVQHPKYKNNEATLEEILRDYGMETKYGFTDDGRWQNSPENKKEQDEFDYYHRSLSGHVVKCPRFKGIARSDGRWRSWVSHFLNLPAEFSGANLNRY